MKKLTILILAIILTSLTLAIPQILYSAITIPYGNCGDTDADGNLNVQFKNKGSVAGIFRGDFAQNGTNQTVSGVFTDYCRNSTTLAEFTCGSSFSQQYSGLAGSLQFDCTELGNYSCNQGACVPSSSIPNGWQLYDDFSSGSLINGLWEIRPDFPFPAPGIPLISQWGVINRNGSYVFNTYTPQNSASSAVYLVPTHHFVKGDIFEYEVDVINRGQFWGSLLILDSPSSISPGIYQRIGINGVGLLGFETSNYPYDEIGLSKVRVTFLNNSINLTQISPSNQTYERIFPISYGSNGFYEVYIGSRIGYSGGGVDANYDNFYIYSNNSLNLTNNFSSYDYFSLPYLNNQLWIETQDPEGQPFMGIHQVSNSKYNVENIGTPDQRVILNLINHTFVPGEHLEYDLNYIYGSGNRIMVIFLNGGPVDRLFGDIGCYWCGSIGHNGQDTNIGNAFGLYHTKLDFLNNGINYTVIRPNNSVYNQLIPITNWNYASNVYSSAPPWNLGFETFSNGAIHTEYDNFVIYSNNPNPQTNNTNSTIPLVALWHFNEGTGNITADSSGNGNTGAINGATWTTGYLGNALDFDGSNDLVTTIHTPSLDVTNAIEIEAWVRHDALGYGTIVSKNGPYILAIYNNKVHGGVYANDGLSSGNTWTEIDGTTNLQVGVWYKLKMKYDGSSVKVYVNDLLENSAPKIGQMPQVSQNLNIGYGDWNQNHYFNGIIDEVSIRGY